MRYATKTIPHMNKPMITMEVQVTMISPTIQQRRRKKKLVKLADSRS
jgi:hypothetical protein